MTTIHSMTVVSPSLMLNGLIVRFIVWNYNESNFSHNTNAGFMNGNKLIVMSKK